MRDQDYAIALAAVAVERGMNPGESDPTDFTDPAARALAERITLLLGQEARDDWRPDVLDLAREDWLEGPIARIQTLLDDVRRLTDVQIAAEAQRVGQQLRLSRLAVEIGESILLLDEAAPDEIPRILATIAEKNRERAALWKGAGAPGPPRLGKRVALIPSRFRLPAEQFGGS